MAKLKLIADPTFTAKVGIPLPGDGDESSEVRMVFKHRTKKVLDEWINANKDKADADAFMDMVQGWDIEAPFTKENVELMLENYIGAYFATFKTYLDQLIQARLGN